MPNRNLSADELKRANELLADIRKRLADLASADPLLLFAYRRKIAKELGYVFVCERRFQLVAFLFQLALSL